MTAISSLTHEFRRKKIDHDGSGLYTSFRFVNGTLNSIDNNRVRSLVADYICKNENLRLLALHSGIQCTTVDEYCTKVKKQNLQGGEPELRALAMISRTVIQLVWKTKAASDKDIFIILNYGEDIESFEKCLYIFYDEENKHYDPLYVVNKENPDDILPPVQRGDKIVGKLLNKFIQEELCDGTIRQSEPESLSNGHESASEIKLFNETEQMFNTIVPKAKVNVSYTQDIDNIVFGSDDNDQTPILIPHELIDLTKPTKSPELDTNEPFAHSSTDFNEHQTERMRFEVEPIQKFRGRTIHEYKPKKALKRNGQPSTPRKLRHFADRNRKNVLKLLIPENDLSLDAEHQLKIWLITQEINGYSYINSHFKFLIHPTDYNIPDENPISIPFDLENLENYSEGMKRLLLRLVVLKGLDAELMDIEQPLQIFSSSQNGLAITKKFTDKDEFIEAYDLYNLRFAVILCKKQPGETAFHQYDNIQCISEITTAVKQYKKVKK